MSNKQETEITKIFKLRKKIVQGMVPNLASELQLTVGRVG
jgi:hypothetical protein